VIENLVDDRQVGQHRTGFCKMVRVYEDAPRAEYIIKYKEILSKRAPLYKKYPFLPIGKEKENLLIAC